jgi:integrase
LRWTGDCISEVLAVAPAAFDLDSGVISLEMLKRRRRGIVRQVPEPPDLLDQLDREFDLRTAQHDPNLVNRRIWRCSRTTAWRQVKSAMAAAGIIGTPAMPKGLRHSFCVNAIQSHAASSRSALARACVPQDDRDLCRTGLTRRIGVREKNVGEGANELADGKFQALPTYSPC